MLDSSSQSISSQVAQIMDKYGIPQNVWGPIMQLESGGNATAHYVTNREDSVGLFQLNRMGGLGTGYTVSQLQDPSLNATIAAQNMAPAYQAGVSQGLSGYALTQYVAFNSGWPTMQGVKAVATDPVVSSYNSKLQAAYSGGNYSSASVSSSSTPTTLQEQLSSLQSTLEGGTGVVDSIKSFGTMTLIAVLGIVLIFTGLKMFGGGTSIQLIKGGSSS